MFTQNTKLFLYLSPLALGLWSLFLITPWYILSIPFTCHNYLGNVHCRMNIFVWGGTGRDTLSLLIQMILHIKKDSIYMGKHLELTLDRFYILWGIFPSIYAQKGDNHACDYFSICFWYSVGPRLSVILFSYSCGALYKIRSISPQAID